jgi:hypothetical protein
MGYKSEVQVLEVKVRSGVISVHKFVLRTQAKVIVDMIVTTLIKVKSFNRQCAFVFLQCLNYSQNRGLCECLFLNCREDL